MRSDLALALAPPRQDEPRGFWAKIKATAGRVPIVEQALAAWYCATDSATPVHVKAVIFGALAYFIAPIDMIPDVVAGLGYTDDAAVLTAVIGTIQHYMLPEHSQKARDYLGTNNNHTVA